METAATAMILRLTVSGQSGRNTESKPVASVANGTIEEVVTRSIHIR